MAAEALAFITLAILAHLIPPAVYGRVAIALVLQSLAIGLTNEGFGNSLVQRRHVVKEHFECAAFLSLGFGVLLAVLTFVLAPLIATPLYGSQTTHLIQLGAILFPVYSFVVVPEAILQRRLDLRRITIVETTGSLVASVLSVALAFAGLGGASIVLGAIAGGVITAGMLLRSVGMPRPRWNRERAREVREYGLPASFAGLAYLGVGNIDNVLIGARLGAAQLGLYYRAFALGVSNQMKIGMILMRVAFPAYSRSRDDADMRRMRDRMTRLNITVILPLLVLLAVGAPKLVPFVLGRHWTEAVVPTQILAFAGIASCLTHCAYPFLFAAGRARAVLNLNVFTLVIYAAAILIALPHGLHAVCFAVVATNIAVMAVVYLTMSRLTKVPFRKLWDDISASLTGGLVVAAVTIPLARILSNGHLPAFVPLAAIGLAGGMVYLGTLRLCFRPIFDDALLVVGGVLGRRSQPGPATTKLEPLMSPGRRLVSERAQLPVGAAAGHTAAD